MASFLKLVCASALLLATASASTQERRSYFKPGGELELRPVLDEEKKTITSVSWKKGSYVAADFVKDAIPVTYYGTFRERTELDTGTGRLRIRDATAADAGEYKLELNGVIQNEPYEAIIPDDVPKPEVRFYPVACDPSDDECAVGCEGDVSKAGDVTYSWKLGNGDWEERGQKVTLRNNATIQAVEHLGCRIENLLGSKYSDTAKNPLYQPSNPGAIGGGIFGVIVVVGLAVGGYFLYKKINDSKESSPPVLTEVSTPAENVPLKSPGESTGPANGESAAATSEEVSTKASGEDTPTST